MNILSGILFFIAFFPYILAIVNGETVPSPVTWAIWTMVDVLALLALKKKKLPTGQITGAVAGALVVTTLAIIYGKPSMGSIEWVSIAGAATGIILWHRTGNAFLALVCSQAATFIGAIPTFVGGYNNPAQEDPVAWTIWLASCICALMAVPKWDWENALQPITFTVIEATMVVLVVIRPLLL